MKTNSKENSFTNKKILKIDFQNFHVAWRTTKSISQIFFATLHDETIVKYVFHEMLWKKYFTIIPHLKQICLESVCFCPLHSKLTPPRTFLALKSLFVFSNCSSFSVQTRQSSTLIFVLGVLWKTKSLLLQVRIHCEIFLYEHFIKYVFHDSFIV